MAIRTETIVTRYEVSTIQHEQGLDRIRQKQEQLRREMADWNEATKAHEKATADMWKAVGVGLVGVGAAIVAGRAAFKDYAEQSRLSTAALGADIDRLQKASAGLVSRTELLTFAAQAQHGVFKLSNEEMATAQRAIRALTQQGFQHEDVTKKVTDAVVALKDDGLKDLGFRLRATTNDADKFAAIMEALGSKAKGVDDSVLSQTESIQALGVRFEDTFTRIKGSIGEMVVAMEPLIRGAAALGEKAGGLIQTITTGWSALANTATWNRQGLYATFGRDPADYEGGPAADDWVSQYVAAGGNAANVIAGGGSLFSTGSGPSNRGSTTQRDTDTLEMIARAEAAEAARKKLWGNVDPNALKESPQAKALAQAHEERTKALIDNIFDLLDDANREGIAAAAALEEERAAQLTGYGSDVSAIGSSIGSSLGAGRNYLAQFQEQLTREDRYASFAGARSESQLASMFGPIEDFNAYASAFGLLQGAASSAFDAWITGSMGVAEATKKAIGEGLKATALQLIGQSILHGVYAIGSLAFGDVQGATTHGLAAAKAAAGAVAVGALAKITIGGGGGGGGPAAPSGRNSAGAAPSGGGGPRAGGNTYVVSYNDAFTQDSSYRRERTARRLISTAMGIPGVTS